MMGGRSLAILLWAAGCIDVASEPVSVPPEADWLVLLQFSPNGDLEAAAGPAPSDGPLPLVIPNRDDWSGLLLGYTDAEIRGLAPELDTSELVARANAEPPRLGTGCDPLLPAPVLALEREAERWTPTEKAPPVTADWLLDRCPDAKPELWFDLSECVSLWCPREQAPRDRCRSDVRFLGCGLSPLELRVESEQQLCVAGLRPEGSRGSDPATILEDAFGVQCSVRVAEREPFMPSLRKWSFAEFVPGLEAPPERRLFQGSVSAATFNTPFGGAADFVVLEDRVIVSTVHGSADGCVNREPSNPRLVRFSRVGDDLVDATTATASPCLYFLEPAPDRRSFFGVYVTGARTFALGRFDGEGREFARREVTMDFDTLRVGGLAVHEDEVFVSLRARAGSDTQESAIIRFDLDTLEPDLERSRYWDATAAGGNSTVAFLQIRSAGRFLLVSEVVHDLVYVLDPENGLRGPGLRNLSGGANVADILADPVRGRLFATGGDKKRNGFVGHAGTELCHDVGFGTSCDWRELQFAGAENLGLRLAAWPGRPGQMASFVGLQKGNQIATHLAILDLDAEPHARYRPASAEVADFPVWTVRTDDTSLWALVPDIAAIVRITP